MKRYKMHSEKELLMLLKQNNTYVLNDLPFSHILQLKYVILKTAKSFDFSEDVVQNTLIKIWENRMLIDPKQSF